MNIRNNIALSNNTPAKIIKMVYKAINQLSIPAPKVIVFPILISYIFIREVYYFIKRVFICEPIFKAYCTEYGNNLHTGVYIHWIQGHGDIIVGDNVLVDGKVSISFAARYSDKPTLKIGNNTGVNHNCSFVVGKSITIGNFVRIGSKVTFRDSNGHPIEADIRKAGKPPSIDSVKPIVIEDNVWIGADVYIGPGVTIGEGSIVSAKSVVISSIPPYTIVSGNPARKVGTVPTKADAAN